MNLCVSLKAEGLSVDLSMQLVSPIQNCVAAVTTVEILIKTHIN